MNTYIPEYGEVYYYTVSYVDRIEIETKIFKGDLTDRARHLSGNLYKTNEEAVEHQRDIINHLIKPGITTDHSEMFEDINNRLGALEGQMIVIARALDIEVDTFLPIEHTWPSPGDVYHYVSSSGEIKERIFQAGKASRHRVRMGNAFKTREEAIAAKKESMKGK